jgi:hypothetical protein
MASEYVFINLIYKELICYSNDHATFTLSWFDKQFSGNGACYPNVYEA